MIYDIIFNGTDLQDANVSINSCTHQNMASRDTEEINGLKMDGTFRVGSKFSGKIISFNGVLKGSSQEDYSERKDTLKGALSIPGVHSLSVEDDEGTKVWQAECIKCEITEPPGAVTRGEITLEFKCYDPIGKSSSLSTITNNNLTSSPETDTATFGGNYDPLPRITIVTDTANNIAKLFFANNTTGELIKIDNGGAYFANDDQIIIDCENRRITKNGEIIDAYGAIPSFKTGANSYSLFMMQEVDPIYEQLDHDEFFQIYGDIYLAQGFTAIANDTVNQIFILLRRSGAMEPTADLNVEIWDDDGGGWPNAAIANGTTTIDNALATDDFVWMVATFSTPPSITTGNPFYIVVYSASCAGGIDGWDWAIANEDVFDGGYLLRTLDPSGGWTDITTKDGAFMILAHPASSFNVDLQFDYYARWI